jgi:hypothetical protein
MNRMTATNSLSAVRLRAPAAMRFRRLGLLMAACVVGLCAAASHPVVAQQPPTSDPSVSQAPSWRQSRRREMLSQERVAQTPARPEYEYDPQYQYDSASEGEGSYDYATPGGGPAQIDTGGFIGEAPSDFGPYAEAQSCDAAGGHDCHGFDCHAFYARADYLLWWGKGFSAPPLVTTSPTGTPSSQAGVLGLPTTTVLFNNCNFADTSMSGGRIRLGYWLDRCDTAALEGTWYGFGKSTTNFNGSDDQYPILARPFVNVTTNQIGNDAQLVAYPQLFSGNISVLGSSQLTGAEFIFRHALCRGCDWRVDCLLGWRYNRLDDSLVINDSRVTEATQTQFPVGTTLTEWDRFSTRNTFNGVQLGVITEWRRCQFWFETRSTLALGNNRSWVTIDGEQTETPPGGQTIVTPAGLLAQSTNIGNYPDDSFAIVPQLGVNLGWEITCGLWATVGYNFMYWSNVARPGEQIDTDVNLSQLPPGGLVGLARPAFTGIHTDYWAQGLNFGLAYRY